MATDLKSVQCGFDSRRAYQLEEDMITDNPTLYAELHEALSDAIEDAVTKFLAEGGQLSDLDWFTYEKNGTPL